MIKVNTQILNDKQTGGAGTQRLEGTSCFHHSFDPTLITLTSARPKGQIGPPRDDTNHEGSDRTIEMSGKDTGVSHMLRSHVGQKVSVSGMCPY